MGFQKVFENAKAINIEFMNPLQSQCSCIDASARWTLNSMYNAEYINQISYIEINNYFSIL